MEKNRFSKLLKQLLSVAEVKNYTLAQELQYDVSYISKWTSGQLLPTEKLEKKILRGISECVVASSGEEALKQLMEAYQVDSRKTLEMAIFDNLEAEYFYVRDLQKNMGVDVAPRTFFFPELSMPQYLQKMRHPVLRRVSALDVVGAIDLFSMEKEYRNRILGSDKDYIPKGKGYQDVHYTLLINIRKDKWNYLHDTPLLVQLLTESRAVDFRLYASTQAVGKAVFVVKDEFAISGMLLGSDRCMSVVVSEEPDTCNTLYRNLLSMCSRERLLFQKTTMRDMLVSREYIHGLLSLRLQWVIGHLTEHFLPMDLFEELMKELEGKEEQALSPGELRSVQQMTERVLEKSNIRILLYKTAFYDLVVDQEIGFYNCKVRLTPKQQIRYLRHFLELCQNHPNLDVKLVATQLTEDDTYGNRQCIFLGDTVSHIRLAADYNNLLLINRADMIEIFEKTYDFFWNGSGYGVVEEKEGIIENIQHVIQGIIWAYPEADA